MDRKGWFILILCGIGMMLTWQSMSQKREIDELRKEKSKGISGGSLTAETGSASDAEVGATSEGFEQASSTVKVTKEETHTLTSTNEYGDVVFAADLFELLHDAVGKHGVKTGNWLICQH